MQHLAVLIATSLCFAVALSLLLLPAPLVPVLQPLAAIFEAS